MDLHERYPELDRDLKECCQKLFEEKWGHKKFMDVFGKNYIRDEEENHEPCTDHREPDERP